MQHTKTKEVWDHHLPGDDVCRSSVGIVEHVLQHGHELDLIHVHPVTPELEVSDILFSQNVDDRGEWVGGPVEELWYDLRSHPMSLVSGFARLPEYGSQL